MSLILLVEDLTKGKDWPSPQKRRKSASKLSLDSKCSINFPCSTACWPALHILNFSASTTAWADSLKSINHSLLYNTYKCIYTYYTHTPSWFCLCGYLTNTITLKHGTRKPASMALRILPHLQWMNPKLASRWSSESRFRWGTNRFNGLVNFFLEWVIYVFIW